jgi:hypothetical protein
MRPHEKYGVTAIGRTVQFFYVNRRCNPDYVHQAESHPIDFHHLNLGVVRQTDMPGLPIASWHFIVPDILLAIATSILPIVWTVSFLARRRRKIADMSICSRCGYDLRATPRRCPECGTVPAGNIA